MLLYFRYSYGLKSGSQLAQQLLCGQFLSPNGLKVIPLEILNPPILEYPGPKLIPNLLVSEYFNFKYGLITN